MVHFPHLGDGKLSEGIYEGKIKVSVFLSACLYPPLFVGSLLSSAIIQDAVGGTSSEVCHGDVCGPRLETDDLRVNHKHPLPAYAGDTGSWILGSPSVPLPFLASVWSDFDQRRDRTFLTQMDTH